MSALATLPARKIVRAIADAAERWAGSSFPPRIRCSERIAERTGYSMPVVDYALDRLFSSISEETIEAAVRSELGSLAILDRFRSRAGRPNAFAAPIGSVCILSSRTTIGVALFPAIFALCAKCDVLVKDREDALLSAFFETLAEESPQFSLAARAREWEGEHGDAASLRWFDAVVAFGRDETLARVRSSLRPDARFIGYGARASAGYVTRETLADADESRTVAQGAARDLVLYETQGCLSLHVLFVEAESPLTAKAFCERLSRSVEEANVEFPLGIRDATSKASLSAWRNLAAFRAASGESAVYSDPDCTYALHLGMHSEPPPFLPRALAVIPVANPSEAYCYLQRHCVPLEGFAVSRVRGDVVACAIEAGAVRVSAFGALQQPPLSGNHGGHPRIADFVRWIDIEL